MRPQRWRDLFPLWQLRRCDVSQIGRDRTRTERMRCIPQQIENRNFIPYEFQRQQHSANRDDFPILQQVQRGRQR